MVTVGNEVMTEAGIMKTEKMPEALLMWFLQSSSGQKKIQRSR